MAKLATVLAILLIETFQIGSGIYVALAGPYAAEDPLIPHRGCTCKLLPNMLLEAVQISNRDLGKFPIPALYAINISGDLGISTFA